MLQTQVLSFIVLVISIEIWYPGPILERYWAPDDQIHVIHDNVFQSVTMQCLLQGRAGDLLQRAETRAQACPGGDHPPGTGAEMSAKVRVIMVIVMKMIMMICRQVVIPTIQCEDLSERSCVKLPNAEETTLDVTACVPVVDKPKCDKVNPNKTGLWDHESKKNCL